MTHRGLKPWFRACSACSAALLGAVVPSATTLGQWPGWGGPGRDFQVNTKGLASEWPPEGPKRLWSRPLGDGYSGIVVQDDRLYTMHRDGYQEVVDALSTTDGKAVWEYRYAVPWPSEADSQGEVGPSATPPFDSGFGIGPSATPLIEDGRLYTLGRTGRITCLNAATGAVVWSHDLVMEYRAAPPDFGFASSPIAHRGMLIAAVGGPGVGVMAFDLASGGVKWQRHDFEDVYSSPIVISVGGQDQVVLLVDREVVGLDPANGDIKWRHPHENQWKTNISTPLWSAKDDLLFVTAAGDAGSRALTLRQKDGATEVKEAWATRKMGAGQSNVIRVGDFFYGCSGDDTASFIGAINAKSGDVAWQVRGYPRGTVVYGDGKLIVLDEDGRLTLAEVTPKEFRVRSKVDLLKKTAWTVPTLVGRTLYARDKEQIVALDLGKG